MFQNDFPLSPQQFQAIELLVSGVNVTDTARQLGVARVTVSRWLNQDPVFIAAYNERRQELWDAANDHQRNLRQKSLQVLDDLLDSEDERIRMRAAISILRAANVKFQYGEPRGHTDPGKVQKAIEDARYVRALKQYVR